MPERRLRWLITVVCLLAVGALSEAAAREIDEPHLWVTDYLVGAAAVLIGAHSRSRQLGTGWVLLAFALAWWGALLIPAALYLHRALILHAILVFPGLRTSPAGALALVAVYVASFTPLAGSELGTAVFGVGLVSLAGARWAIAAGPRRRYRRGALMAAVPIALVALSVLFVGPEWAVARIVAYSVAFLIALGVLGLAMRPTTAETIADAVFELGGSAASTWQEALARRVGDPTLTLAFAGRDGKYRTGGGRLVDPEAAPKGRAVTRVELDGAPDALIVHDADLVDSEPMLRAVRLVARLWARNAALDAGTTAKMRELVSIRRRLLRAEDLASDQLVHQLQVGSVDQLRSLARKLQDASATDGLSGKAADHLGRALRLLDETVEELLDLARGMAPRELDDGLDAALRALAARTPFPVTVSSAGVHVEGEPAIVAYFVCAEAIANTLKHARASAISIEVTSSRSSVVVVVTDDGIGGADASGSGLSGLASRVERAGGILRMESQPGRGTRLIAEMPLSDQSAVVDSQVSHRL